MRTSLARRSRAIALLAAAVTAVAGAAACSDDTPGDAPGADAAAGDASTVASDAGGGADGTVMSDAGATDAGTDAGPLDAGVDAAPLCTSSPCITQIAVGYEHACALVVDGTVRCWGSNTNGALGTGADAGKDGGLDVAAKAKPVTVDGLANVVAISSGIYHSCALKNDGSVWCWGANYNEQLGAVDAGNAVATPRQAPFTSPVAELVAGGYRTCVRTTSGGVECVGDNGNGQLGGGDAAPPNAPAQIATPTVMVGVVGAVDLDVALRQTCVLVADGGVYCVGRNLEGQLGRGDAGGSSSTAAPVIGLPAVARLGVMAGNSACAITPGGDLHCWGQSAPSSIAPDAATPAQPFPMKVPGVTDVAEVSGGYFSTCARLGDGGVSCWGDNSGGQLGVAPDASAASVGPVAIGGLAKAIQISASWDKYVCALIEGGAVYCWGNNENGRLGRGEDAAALPLDSTPQPVSF